MAASCVLPADSQVLRRTFTPTVADATSRGPPARLYQHEKRELFAAFAYQEPVLLNKLLGLKFPEDLAQSLVVISVCILGEFGDGRRERLLALARQDDRFFADFGAVDPVVFAIVLTRTAPRGQRTPNRSCWRSSSTGECSRKEPSHALGSSTEISNSAEECELS
jgi:hypothetical protein